MNKRRYLGDRGLVWVYGVGNKEKMKERAWFLVWKFGQIVVPFAGAVTLEEGVCWKEEW